MNINDIHKIFSYLTNRVQSGNTTPDRENTAYNIANTIMFRKYMGLPEAAEGAPIPYFSSSQQIDDIMERFKVPVKLSIDADGYVNKPSDLIQVSTIGHWVSEDGSKRLVPVKLCSDIEFQEVASSYVVPADINNPACRFIGGKVEFLPSNIVHADMVYYRMPLTPIWGYSISSGRPVYDSAASVNPEWPDNLAIEFAVTAVQTVAVNAQRAELYQLMTNYKNNQ